MGQRARPCPAGAGVINIDLAAPGTSWIPPSRHLLWPLSVFGILLPLLLALCLQVLTSDLRQRASLLTVLIEERETASGQVQREAALVAQQRAIESRFDAIRHASGWNLALVTTMLDAAPANLWLSSLKVGPEGIVVSGETLSATHVATWLAVTAPALMPLVWEAPELQQSTTPPRIGFVARAVYQTRAVASPARDPR